MQHPEYCDMSIFSRFIDISCGCVDGADMYRKRGFLITSQASCSKSGNFLSVPNHIDDILDMGCTHCQCHNALLNKGVRTAQFFARVEMLDRLEAICTSLARHIEALEEAGNGGMPANERPPPTNA